ncbi:MAG TPA: hypothetical protein VFP70_02375 [Burkholderiales bacterium]|nr:hypothetical protein [Burkholderiales bacterium]
MEEQNQIYFWKRLYWQAIQDGYEPGQAEQFANQVLATQLTQQTPAAATAPAGEGQAAS